MGSEGRARAAFRVLGPVELATGAGHVALTGKQGALLAILLLNANHVVSVQRLAELLWREPLPSAPSSRVRMLVSDLRRTCRTAGADPIRTQRPGYVVRLKPDQLDLTDFLDRVARAREASAEGDPASAVARYDEALSRWRGAPLDGINGSFVETEVARLEELRLQAREERAAALLATGRHAEAIAELNAVVTDHPLREPAHGQLMTALHRSGRRVDALAVYRSLRDRVVAEMGLEPEPELQRLHQRILTSDTALDAPRATADPADTAPGPPVAEPPVEQPGPAAHAPAAPIPVPRQLPAPPAHFVGRERERAELDRLAGERRTNGVAIAAISGTGGMGKTSLALRWAHDNMDLFPDGQLYVNLHGFDPTSGPLPPHVALRHLLTSLGIPAAAMPAGKVAQSGLYRSLVAGRRLLVVLDNARDVAQVEPLLPGGPHCTVLITSRNRLPGLSAASGATLIGLGALTDADAHRLLRRHLGDSRVAEDPGSVAVLVRHTGGLPLAIGVLTARAAMHPDFPLSILAKALSNPSTRLDVLRTGDLNTDLRAAFAASYEALDAATARLFTLLGLAPWPDVGLRSAAALAGLPLPDAELSLYRLEAANLIHQQRPGRYRMHDLVRLYAAERAQSDRTDDERAEALTRLVDSYAHTASTADRVLYPGRPLAARIFPDPARDEFEDADSAWAWFEDEQPGLVAVQRLAARLGMDAAVFRLAWAADTYHKRCQHEQRVESWQLALDAAGRLGHRNTEAFAHWYLGYAYAQAARVEDGLEHLLLALDLFEQDGDVEGQAHTSHTLGFAWLERGEPARALPHVENALRLQRELQDPRWEANALSAAGWCHAVLGHHSTAQSYCERALRLFRRHEDRNGESATLDSLGYIAHRAGRPDEALHYYGRCLELRESLGNAYQAADTLVRIGDVHHGSGRLTAARRAWQRALDSYREQRRAAEADNVREKIRRLAVRPSSAARRAGHEGPADR
ncbi:DNA-binding transcriptional activator of the SARP family [Micromonospora citrea]|uniref:DNA-binding transcriptional activator of the SARP family n=1 Tax=Micromonospora citrea TaxID=47855 RepID=A0A1C6USK8_9ACTN|nr:BTAD domain-containing putative transcriptional regulator [Micromonospora citrea]SCL57077.1 DNA-binding transcriptional activator of the SARP family [Micromonospora citrea]